MHAKFWVINSAKSRIKNQKFRYHSNKVQVDEIHCNLFYANVVVQPFRSKRCSGWLGDVTLIDIFIINRLLRIVSMRIYQNHIRLSCKTCKTWLYCYISKKEAQGEKVNPTFLKWSAHCLKHDPAGENLALLLYF